MVFEKTHHLNREYRMNPTLLKKYCPFEPTINLSNRRWPNNTITAPPIWCSVDLRDGNQSLSIPMNISQKLQLFETLVACGFKEIEIGFPAASNTEFQFVRTLIAENRIPDDVTIQVLVQAREVLIIRTIDSLVGAKRVIIHLYNSTSPAQRRIVFCLEKSGSVAMAVRGVKWIIKHSAKLENTEVTLQYSPESFSATETDFALEICHAVMDVWQPTSKNKIILNLPSTVEVSTPNRYADQIEWFTRHLKSSESVVVSVHTHNDRGTGNASTELALLAGARRVEGTLFGNGERTGNADIVTLALNMYTQGIDPKLDLHNLDAIIAVYENCTGMTIHPRHPYAGELVFTAFSGSHQDAIRKGLAEYKMGKREVWDVPYLPIDPEDIGRRYQKVIRVNSQSGKGGIAHLLETQCGIELPPEMAREFGPIANERIDALGREVTAEEIKGMFWREYVDREIPIELQECGYGNDALTSDVICSAWVRTNFTGAQIGTRKNIIGRGNGSVSSFVNALQTNVNLPFFNVENLVERALASGNEARAIAYIEIKLADGSTKWGLGVEKDSKLAPLKAIVSALNRVLVSQKRE